MLPARKRNRSSIVCTFCRKRKVKCDKGNPCSTCVKYGNNDCHYTEPVRTLSLPEEVVTEALPLVDGVHLELEALKRKIRLLEKLVNDLAPPAPAVPPPASTYGYPERRWPASKTLRNGLLLNLVGHNPVESLEETYLFHNGYQLMFDQNIARPRHFGPLLWISLLQVDRLLSKFWLYAKRYKHQRDRYMGNIVKEAQARFGNRGADALDHRGPEMKPYKDVYAERHSRPTLSALSPNRLKINERALSLGLSFYEGGIDEELELLDKIELILPKKRVIWCLVDRFFSHIYIFMPFLDEPEFRDLVTKIIGPRSDADEKVSKIAIERKIDFTTVGLLLVIVRFGYLTLFTNSAAVNEANLSTDDPSPYAQKIKYLLSNPVNVDVFELAEACLQQFDLIRTVNLQILQLTLYIHMYNMYAPEGGDPVHGNDTLAYIGRLVQMAYSIGLHRDPLNSQESLVVDERRNNLSRKIWYHLMILDMNNALMNGARVQVDANSYDTEMPSYKPGNENVNDLETEKIGQRAYTRSGYIFDRIKEILDMISNVKSGVNMHALCSLLNGVEMHQIQEYGRLENHLDEASLTREQIFFKTLRMKIHFSSTFFLVSVYFHFFNHYERKNNKELAFYYIKKIFVNTIHDLMPFYSELLENSHVIFKNSSDLLITPGFESIVHKSIITITAIVVRIRFSILKLELSPTHVAQMSDDEAYKSHFLLLQKLSGLLWKCWDNFNNIMLQLSSRYYYAWRVTKAQRMVIELVKGDEFFNSQQQGLDFDTEMLDELIDIIQLALDTMRLKKHRHHSSDSSMDQAPSTGSTTSASEDFVNKVDVQTDDLWLQMMILKNGPSETPQQFDDQVDLVFNNLNSSLDYAFFNGGDVRNVAAPQDVFDNLPFDDLMKNYMA